MSKVFAVLIIVALASFVVYEVISLVVSIVRKIKLKKAKNDEDKNEFEEGE